MAEVPSPERPALKHLAAEHAAQRGEAQFVPWLAGQRREQRAEVAFAPAAAADRDQAETPAV